MQDTTDAIRTVLLDDWDPIGVGPTSHAESLGIANEYDDLVAVLANVRPAEGTGRILFILTRYREILGVPGLGNDEQIAETLEQILLDA